MAEQHITRTITYSAYGRVNPTGGTTEMIEAQFAPKGKKSWRKWDLCQICGFSYPKEELIYINGAPYCIRFEHYRDVPGNSGLDA